MDLPRSGQDLPRQGIRQDPPRIESSQKFSVEYPPYSNGRRLVTRRAPTAGRHKQPVGRKRHRKKFHAIDCLQGPEWPCDALKPTWSVIPQTDVRVDANSGENSPVGRKGGV